MIVVTGGKGDSNDMGTLLGMIRERTPTTEQLDENTLRTIVREELVNLTTGRRVDTDNSGSSNRRRLSKGERQEDQGVA
jgi:hypothetical protein